MLMMVPAVAKLLGVLGTAAGTTGVD